MKYFFLIKKYKKEKFTFGIDLGSSNTLISFIFNNKINYYKDKKDRFLVPTIIYYSNLFKKFFSNDIFNNLICNYNDIIFFLKSLLIKDFRKKNIYNNLSNNLIFINYNFKINTFNGIKNINLILLDFFIFLKINIYKTFYIYLKNIIISIPVYSSEIFKKKYKKIFLLLKINILYFLLEPISAFISLNKTISNNNFIIYDLGASTFDLTFINTNNDIIEVLYSTGDNNLGGNNFNNIILNYLIYEYKSFWFFNYKENYNSLYKKISFIKEKLSYFNYIFIKIYFIKYIFYLKEYELLINFLIEKSVFLICNSLIKININDISLIKNIILTGGSTITPIIKSKIFNLFLKIFNFNFNPIKCVSIGCSIFSYYLLNNYKKNKLFLINKIPFSLGIEVIGGNVEFIIKKNSKIPIISYKDFTIFIKNQKYIFINILQGNNKLVSNCNSLFYFKIKNKVSFFKKKIRVYFKIDLRGFFYVIIKTNFKKSKKLFFKTFLKIN